MGELRSVVPGKWNHEARNRYWFSWNFTGHTHAFARWWRGCCPYCGYAAGEYLGGGSRVAPVIKCVLRVPWAWGSRSWISNYFELRGACHSLSKSWELYVWNYMLAVFNAAENGLIGPFQAVGGHVGCVQSRELGARACLAFRGLSCW